MASTAFKGYPIELSGNLPTKGSKAPGFLLTSIHLNDFELEKYAGKKLLIFTFLSVDSEKCNESVKMFNHLAKNLQKAAILCVSRDLPNTQYRFCETEDIRHIDLASDLRPESSFGEDYGVVMMGGPYAGALAQSTLVLNEKHEVIYSELVADFLNTPNFEAAMALLA